jgi:hypothetical protein
MRVITTAIRLKRPSRGWGEAFEWTRPDKSIPTSRLYHDLVEALHVASDAERLGVFFGVGRTYLVSSFDGSFDGSFDVEEHHYMLTCRCRVINTSVVQWCAPHARYYSRMLSLGNYGRQGWQENARRWEGVVEDSTGTRVPKEIP